jgi:hypothetical protein
MNHPVTRGAIDAVTFVVGGGIEGVAALANLGKSLFSKTIAKTGTNWAYGTFKSETKWANQMLQRGWTEKQITEAITKGKAFNAVNMVNKTNGATRFVHPTTGQSVVIDNVTKQLLHVGGPGFQY